METRRRTVAISGNSVEPQGPVDGHPPDTGPVAGLGNAEHLDSIRSAIGTIVVLARAGDQGETTDGQRTKENLGLPVAGREE